MTDATLAGSPRLKPWELRQPFHTSSKLCEYIVLAEFDIDTGSTVRHQYPSKVPNYAEDWFAENMLPEGVHNRQIDYTYIFLNRQGIIVNSNESAANSLISAECSPSDSFFLFGINLCMTKHDSSVRRGAIVKAMAIFSRFSFVEIFKKPLDATLQEYFQNPGVAVLEGLYNSLNDVDTSKFPCPTPLEQSLMTRGCVYDPLGSFIDAHTPMRWTYSSAFQLQFNESSDVNETREGNSPSSPRSSSCIPFTIPLHRTVDEVGDINLTLLVRTFGEASMRIYNAILMKQRILFVGYNHAASDVAKIVLSSVAMVAPPIANVIRRTYAYANLNDMSFLEVPGYIAGVTNPMFQEHESWWDLLCVLDLPNNTGTVKSADEKRADDAKSQKSGSSSSSPLPSIDETGAHAPFDAKFIGSVLAGVSSGIGELWVRQKFLDYTVAIVNQAQAMSVLVLSNTGSHPSTPMDDRDEDNGKWPRRAGGAAGGGGGGGIVAGDKSGGGGASKVGGGFRLGRFGARRGLMGTGEDGTDYTRKSPQFRRELEANVKRAGLMRDAGALQSLALHPWVWVEPPPSPCLDAAGGGGVGGLAAPVGIATTADSTRCVTESTGVLSGDEGAPSVGSDREEGEKTRPSAGVADAASRPDDGDEREGDGGEGDLSVTASVSGTNTPDSTASPSPSSAATDSVSSDGARTAMTDDSLSSGSTGGEPTQRGAVRIVQAEGEETGAGAVSAAPIVVVVTSTPIVESASLGSSGIPPDGGGSNELKFLSAAPASQAIFTPVAGSTDGDASTAATLSAAAAVDGYLLKCHILRLQSETALHPVIDAQPIFVQVDQGLVSEESVQALLTLLPESQGGVHPLAAGLFHSNPTVRLSAVNILMKMEQYPSTLPVVMALNGMLKAAYERQKSKLVEGILTLEIEDYNERQAVALALAAAAEAEAEFNAQISDTSAAALASPGRPSLSGALAGLGGAVSAPSPPPPNLFRSASDTSINALDMIP